MNKLNIILSGIVRNNPTFVLVLGMCPTLGTTTSAGNGMGMGLATMAVLIMSNLVISLIKNIIPDKVRIPAFIVVIASFVTVVEMLMKAYTPPLYEALGVFIPLSKNKRLDFPEPEGPRIPTNSPGWISTEMSRQAATSLPWSW